MSNLIYCTCGSTNRGILERRLCDPSNPNGGKWIMPSFLCPDCKNHRPLNEIKYEPPKCKKRHDEKHN